MTTNHIQMHGISLSNLAMTNITISGPIATNWIIRDNYMTPAPKMVFVTNYVTVEVQGPSSPIHIPIPATTTIIGIVFCLLCVWRLWWLRKADKTLKAAREAAYDYYLSIKNPPHVRSIYE